MVFGVGVAAGVVVLGGVWIAVTGLMARSQLQDARADVSTLRSAIERDDVSGAQQALGDLRSHASSAQSLTSGPAWALGAALPGGGALQTVRGLADAVDTLADHAAPALVQAREALTPATLRSSNGAMNVAALATMAPVVQAAGATVTSVQSSVAALPGSTGVGAVDSARRDLLDELDSVAGPVRTASLALRVAPTLLGADRPRRYFVGFVNESELRGSGGLPGGFGILLADRGRLTFESFHPDSDLDGVRSQLNFGAEYRKLWGNFPNYAQYTTSNISANFPYAARTWAAMWQQRSGQRVDGAISVDPTALGYLLGRTGSATLPNGAKIGGDAVAAFLQQGIYTMFPKQAQTDERKAYLVAVARATASEVVARRGSVRPLLSAARRAVDERRLLLWSSDASVAAALGSTAITGQVPVTRDPFVAPVVVNDSGGKLDYYLDRSATWSATGCGSTRTTSMAMTLHDSAPTGLPAYVVDRTDDPKAAYGSEHLRLVYYATTGARLVRVELDGRSVSVRTGTEQGHPVFVVPVELPRGAARTVRFTFSEPNNGAAPIVVRQAGARPIRLDVRDPVCS